MSCISGLLSRGPTQTPFSLDTTASSMTHVVSAGPPECGGQGISPSSTNETPREEQKMHKHPNTRRMLRWRPAAAALAAAVAASTFLATPSAQANEPSDPPANQQMPAPAPVFPLPTKHTQNAYDPAPDLPSK